MRTPKKSHEQWQPEEAWGGANSARCISGLVRGLELGVDQKSHDQWVMSMSAVESYDERGEARDTASYHGARGARRIVGIARIARIAGIEGGRYVLADRVTAVVGYSTAEYNEQELRCRCP